MDQLDAIIPTRKSGDEHFFWNNARIETTLKEFWQWSVSDLVSNATRGILAEFIVANALAINKDVRSEWDAWDLDYGGLRIEVKASAYLQSWKQNALSNIIFGIHKSLAWDFTTNTFGTVKARHSDVYIFCVLHEQNPQKINPMELNQWDFYILRTSILDEKMIDQRTISLKRLESLNPTIVKYDEIRKEMDKYQYLVKKKRK